MTKTTDKKTTSKKAAEAKTVKTVKAVKLLEEPDFKDSHEELAWLKKHQKKLDEQQQYRLEFLSRPIQVITEKAKPKKKKPVAKKVKPAILLDNGEYIATPKTLPKLKSYVSTYCKAMGWKKNFTFQDIKPLGFKDFKIEADKEKNEVYVKGTLVWQTAYQMFTKDFKRTFTIENHKSVKDMIVKTYRYANENFKGKKVVDGDALLEKGWGCVYDI